MENLQWHLGNACFSSELFAAVQMPAWDQDEVTVTPFRQSVCSSA